MALIDAAQERGSAAGACSYHFGASVGTRRGVSAIGLQSQKPQSPLAALRFIAAGVGSMILKIGRYLARYPLSALDMNGTNIP